MGNSHSVHKENATRPGNDLGRNFDSRCRNESQISACDDEAKDFNFVQPTKKKPGFLKRLQNRFRKRESSVQTPVSPPSFTPLQDLVSQGDLTPSTDAECVTNQQPTRHAHTAAVDHSCNTILHTQDTVFAQSEEDVRVSCRNDIVISYNDITPIPSTDVTAVTRDDVTSGSSGDKTPVQDKDVTPVPSNDGTPVQDKDVPPVPSDDNTPVQDKDVTLVPSDDDTPVQDKDVTPVRSDDTTPVQDRDATPVQHDDVKYVASHDNTPVQDKDVTLVPSNDDTPVQQDVTPVPSDDITPVQDKDIKSVPSDDNTPMQDKNVKSVPSDDDTSVQDKDVKSVPSDDNISVQDKDVTPVPSDEITHVPSDDNILVQHNDVIPALSDDNTHESCMNVTHVPRDDVVSQVHCIDVTDKHRETQDTSSIHTDDASIHTDDAAMLHTDDARVPCYYEVGCSYRQGGKDASETDPGQSQNNNPAEKEESRIIVSDNLGKDPSGNSSEYREATSEASQARNREATSGKRNVFTDLIGKFYRRKRNDPPNHVITPRARFEHGPKVLTNILGNGGGLHGDIPVCSRGCQTDRLLSPEIGGNIFTQQAIYGRSLYPHDDGLCFNRHAISGYGLDRCAQIADRFKKNYDWRRGCRQVDIGLGCGKFEELKKGRGNIPDVACMSCYQYDASGQSHRELDDLLDCRYRLVFNIGGQQFHRGGQFQVNDIGCQCSQAKGCSGHQMQCTNESVHQMQDDGERGRRSPSDNGHSRENDAASVRQCQAAYKCCCMRRNDDGCIRMRQTRDGKGRQLHGGGTTRISDYGNDRERQSHYGNSPQMQSNDGGGQPRQTDDGCRRFIKSLDGNSHQSQTYDTDSRQTDGRCRRFIKSRDGNSRQSQTYETDSRQNDDGCRRFIKSRDGYSRQSQTDDTDSRQMKDVDEGPQRQIDDGWIQEQTEDGVVHQGQRDDVGGQERQNKYGAVRQGQGDAGFGRVRQTDDGDDHPMQTEVGDNRHMLPFNGVGHTNEDGCQRQSNDVDERQMRTNDGGSPRRQASGGSGRNNGDGCHKEFVDQRQDKKETLPKCRDEGQCQNVSGTGSRHMYVDVDGRCYQQGGDGGDRFKRIDSNCSSIPDDDGNKNNGSIQGKEYLADKDAPAIVSHYPNESYQNKKDQTEMEYQFIEAKNYGSLEHIKLIAKARRLKEIQAKVHIHRGGRLKAVMDNVEIKDSGSNGQKFKQRHNSTVISDCHSPGGNHEQADDVHIADVVGGHHQRAHDSDRYLPQLSFNGVGHTKEDGRQRQSNDGGSPHRQASGGSGRNNRDGRHKEFVDQRQDKKETLQKCRDEGQCQNVTGTGSRHMYVDVDGRCYQQGGDGGDRFKRIDSSSVPCDDENRNNGSIQGIDYLTDKDVPAVVSHYPNKIYQNKKDQTEMEYQLIDTKKYGSLEHIKLIKLENQAKARRLKEIQAKVHIDRGQGFKQRHNWTVISNCHSPGGNHEQADDVQMYDVVGGHHQRANDGDRYLPQDDEGRYRYEKTENANKDDLQNDESWTNLRNKSNERNKTTNLNEKYNAFGQTAMLYPPVLEVQTKVAQNCQTPQRNCSYSISNGNKVDDDGHDYDAVDGQLDDDIGDQHGQINIADSVFLQKNKILSETRYHSKERKICTTPKENYKYEDQSEIQCPPVETKKYGSLEHMKMIKLQNQAKNKRLKQVQTKVAKTWQTPKRNYSYSTSNDNIEVDDGHVNDAFGYHNDNESEKDVDHGSQKLVKDDSRYLQQNEASGDQYDQIDKSDNGSLHNDERWPETQTNLKQMKNCTTLSDSHKFKNDQSEMQYPPVETKKYGSLEHMKMIKLQNQAKNKRLTQVQTKVAKTWQTPQRNYSYSLSNVNKQVDDKHGYDVVGGHDKIDYDDSRYVQQDKNIKDQQEQPGKNDSESPQDDRIWPETPGNSKRRTTCAALSDNYSYENDQSEIQCPPVETKKYGSLEHMKMIKLQNEAKNKRLKQVQTKVAKTWQTPQRKYSYSLSDDKKQVDHEHGYGPTGDQYKLANNGDQYLQQDDDGRDRYYHTDNNDENDDNWTDRRNCSKENNNVTNHNESFKYENDQSTDQYPLVETKKYGSLEHLKMIKMQNQAEIKRLKQVQTKVAQTWQTPKRNYSYSLSNDNKEVDDGCDYDNAEGHHTPGNNEWRYLKQNDDIGDQHEENDNTDTRVLQNEVTIGNDSSERIKRTNFSEHYKYEDHQTPIQCPPVETKKYGSLEHMKMIKLQNQAKNKRLKQVQTKVAKTWQTPQRNYSYSLSNVNKQVDDKHGYDVVGGHSKIDYNEGRYLHQDGRYQQNDNDSESLQNYDSWAERRSNAKEGNNRTNQHGSYKYKNDQPTVQNHPVETKQYGSVEHMKMINMQNEAKNKRLNKVQTKVAQTWQTPQRDCSSSLSNANQIPQNPQNNHYGSVSHYKSAQQNNSTLKRNLTHASSRINTWNTKTNTRAPKVTPVQVRRPQESSLSKSVPQGPFRRPDQTNKSPWSRTVPKGNNSTAQRGKVVQAITSSGMIYNTYTCI